MNIEIHHFPTRQNSKAKAASLAALIKQHPGISVVLNLARKAELIADHQRVAFRDGDWFTRHFGAAYPDPARRGRFVGETPGVRLKPLRANCAASPRELSKGGMQWCKL